MLMVNQASSAFMGMHQAIGVICTHDFAEVTCITSEKLCTTSLDCLHVAHLEGLLAAPLEGLPLHANMNKDASSNFVIPLALQRDK